MLAGGVWLVSWCGRHALAIHRLRHGTGDTVFLSASGRPWFTLDDRRRRVPLDRIAPRLRDAVVAIEDHRFRRHSGVDPVALGRASWRNARRGELTEGGSTITQQLARMLFLSNRRSWGRKGKEALLALMLEQSLGKDRILELYLNRVYLGGGLYGVEAAARGLFGKPASDLSLPESALLAGLIRAPSELSPWSDPDAALERSHLVLERMRAEGFIGAEAERQARRTRVKTARRPPSADARGGYAKAHLRSVFRHELGDEPPGEWQVQTTFVPEIQDAAEGAVVRGLGRLNRPALQAALVALDPRTGDVLALVGGSDFATTPFNRAIHSRRQPGSAFKPFVYAAALERGLSPVTRLTGLRSLAAGGDWSPRNAQGPEPDEQTLREALLASNNHAAVALQRRLGRGPVLALAGEAGLRDQPDVPSLALGTGLATPLELTAAFAVFASGGLAVRPRAIVAARDATGRLAFADGSPPRRVLSEAAAFQTLSLLRDVLERGTGAAARELGVSFPVAGKTGTTDDFKDAWFVGFSTTLLAGVWVGFDRPASMGEDASGARVALPIWVDFMRRVERLRPPGDFTPLSGLAAARLCRESYRLPRHGCPAYVEYFKPGDERPARRCRVHGGRFDERVGRALGALGRRLKRVLD